MKEISLGEFNSFPIVANTTEQRSQNKIYHNKKNGSSFNIAICHASATPATQPWRPAEIPTRKCDFTI
jgi:hypothetical protein